MPRIVIESEKCKSCGICISVCPNNMIKYSDTQNNLGNIPAEFKTEENKCTGCALCAISCPEIAIKEVLR